MATHSIEVSADNFSQIVIEGSKTAPVVLDFWAPWCAPCRALTPILEKLAAEYAGRFVLAKVNSDQNQDIAASFNVRSIPVVKAIVDGQWVDEFVGALPESQVRAFIERILPTPSDLARKDARVLIDAGRHAEALTALDSALTLDPRNEPARVDQLEVLLKLSRFDEARVALDSLDELALRQPKVAALKAALEFSAGAGGDDGELPALAKRIESDPGDLEARLQLARHCVRTQAYEPALEHLLEIIRRDRKFGDDIGRKTMIEVFNLLGGQGDLVGKYRRLLSSALH